MSASKKKIIRVLESFLMLLLCCKCVCRFSLLTGSMHHKTIQLQLFYAHIKLALGNVTAKGSHKTKCVIDSVHHTNRPHWHALLLTPSHNNPIQVCGQPNVWLPKETILIFLGNQTRRMQGRLRSSFNPMEAGRKEPPKWQGSKNEVESSQPIYAQALMGY